MMINSAILLPLLHYSLLNAQSRSRTHDIKKQTTHREKEKRETFFPTKENTNSQNQQNLSLSLSLSISLVSFSLSVSKAFFYPKISARMC
jgi:hypothetical protein